MKIRLFARACLVLLGAVPRALALAGDLSEPGIALPAHYTETVRSNIMAALRQPDCRFLGGRFLNSHTSLNYAGNTRALNFFLDGLAKCAGVTLSVSFTFDALPDDRCDWHVSHQAGPNRFHVRVNLKSSQIKLAELVIPAVKGPELPPARKPD
jgi:hypothetical protein